MDELHVLRQEIEETDRAIACLFEKRMFLASQIGGIKKAQGLPVCDEVREKQLAETEGTFVSEAVRPYYLRLLREMMALAKEVQA